MACDCVIFSVDLKRKWPRRSMDRTQLCGSCDAGSIPAGVTNLKTVGRRTF